MSSSINTNPPETTINPGKSPLNDGPVIQPRSGLGFESNDVNQTKEEPINPPKNKPTYNFDEGSKEPYHDFEPPLEKDSPEEFGFTNNQENNIELESADKTANKALVSLVLGVFALLIPYLVKSQVKINESAVRADVAAGLLEPVILDAIDEINQKNSKIPVWSKDYDKILKQPLLDVLDEYKVVEVSPTTRLLIAMGSVGTSIFLAAQETQQANREFLRTLYQQYGKTPPEPSTNKSEEPPLMATEEV